MKANSKIQEIYISINLNIKFDAFSLDISLVFFHEISLSQSFMVSHDFFKKQTRSIPFRASGRINYTRLNCAIMQQLGLENTAL